MSTSLRRFLDYSFPDQVSSFKRGGLGICLVVRVEKLYAGKRVGQQRKGDRTHTSSFPLFNVAKRWLPRDSDLKRRIVILQPPRTLVDGKVHVDWQRLSISRGLLF